MIDIELIKSQNEQIYQNILKKYNDSNIEANNYKDSIKSTKLKENTSNATIQARQLEGTFNTAMMKALNSNKAEYEAEVAAKEKPEEYTDKNSSKMIYQQLKKNNFLLETNSILSSGHVQGIESYLDKHIDNEELRNVITSFVSGKSKEDQVNYKSIMGKISTANITPIDGINEMLGIARLNEATPGTIHTNTFGHVITQDFPQKDYFNPGNESNYFGSGK